MANPNVKFTLLSSDPDDRSETDSIPDASPQTFRRRRPKNYREPALSAKAASIATVGALLVVGLLGIWLGTRRHLPSSAVDPVAEHEDFERLHADPAQLLWPIPRKFTNGNKTVFLSPAFDFSIKGNLKSDILREGAKRYNDMLFGPTPRIPKNVTSMRSLEIMVEDGNVPEDLGLETDESYVLEVPDDGKAALLTSKSVYGALRGLDTFAQMVKITNGSIYSIPASPWRIEDAPRFKHRGLLLDTSRNYLPTSDIFRTLDAMSFNKLNVFHWHIVDAPSFPLQSEVLPELSRMGAYNSDSVYTKNDVDSIVGYARYRGIRVIPEFDAPGHTYSWGLAFPNITVCMNHQPDWDEYCASPPCGQLDPTLEESYTVLSKLLKEQATWFPDAFMHAGGDEINMNCWETADRIKQHLSAHTDESVDTLLLRFVTSQHNTMRESKKTPIAWEEVVLNHGLELEKDVVVQVWNGENSKEVVKKGHRVIGSNSQYFYLDCGLGAWLGNNPRLNSWCDPFKTWQKVYSYDLTNEMTPEESLLVLGGEVCMWSEQVDGQNLDSIIWPRAAAAAEVLWSGNKDVDGKSRTLTNALPRLHRARDRLVERGISASPLQPRWCVNNPGMCDFPW